MENFIDFLKLTNELTSEAFAQGDTVEDMLLSTTEELGEVAACISAEKGRKKKDLKEDTKIECIDVVICALSIYFAKGGKIEDIADVGIAKLQKWKENIQRRNETQMSRD
jgi:NTP pyrophosphatase (non-canonical NTP hydrolase)